MSKGKALGLFLGVVTGFLINWAAAPVIGVPTIFRTPSVAFAPIDTTYYFDHRFVYLVPTIDTVMEVVNTSGAVVDSFAGTIPNRDSIPFGTLGRLLDGPSDQGLFITHNWTVPQVGVLDSLEVDSVYTSWSLLDTVAYFIAIEGFPLDTPGPPQQPPGNITPDPVTNLVLTADTTINSIVANWTESADSYQVVSGYNSGPGADITDSTDAPPQAHIVTVDSLYFMCVRAFAGDSISDSRCDIIQYTTPPPGPPPDDNEPAGMTEMFGSNSNFPGDIAGPNKFSFVERPEYDPHGMRVSPEGAQNGRAESVDPTTLGIGAPNSPAPVGGDLVFAGKFPEGHTTGGAPYNYTYLRNWAGQTQRKTMYVRFYMYIDPDFVFHPTTTKGFWMSQDNYTNHFIGLSKNCCKGWALHLQFKLNPSEIPTNVNYGNDPGGFVHPINDIPKGVWFKVEFLFVANSADFVHDGIYRFWKDGVLTVETDTVYYFEQNDTNKTFTSWRHGPTWGGGIDVDVPADQYLLMDDLYISYKSSLEP